MSALRELPTRRGTYRVPHVGLWRERFDAPPGLGVLRPGARVVALGSCFATEASRYLRSRGYRAPRYAGGLLYNASAVRLELEHVLAGREWPQPIELAAGEGVAHRFRRLQAPDARRLRRLDERATRRARRQLAGADVVLVVVGTTAEVWRDAELGGPTNQIPPPDAFHAGGWRLDPGDLDALREDVAAIASVLGARTSARVVCAVCPIPLHATWLDRHVAEANGRSKALLRVALESELRPPAVYLPLWDWMQAQTERRSPTKPDGRHFDRRGLLRIMRFAEGFLAAEPVPAPAAGERLRAWARDMAERHLAPLRRARARR